MKSSDTPKNLVHIRCTFIESLFRSETADYCVCVYEAENGAHFCAVGSDLPEMEYAVTLSGEWKNHPNYGEQLAVDMVADILPHNHSDVVKFIRSSVSQISKEEASALASAFPTPELWNVLYHAPEKLYSILNVGSDKVLKLQRKVKRLSIQRDLTALLGEELPLTQWQYRKICDLFADDPSKILDSIKADPFMLMIAGFKFPDLDKYASRHTNFPVDDYRRLLAATRSVLLEAQDESHTALPCDILIKKLSDALRPMGSVADDTLHGFLSKACTEGDIIVSGGMVYLKRAFEEETFIAERLAAMAALAPKEIDKRKFSRLMKAYGKEKGFELSANQQEAVMTVLTRPVCVITGGPGTGKSTILDAVLFCWKKFNHDHDWCLMAPTGKAAVRITETTGECAGTIHSTLDLGVSSGFDTAELSEIAIKHGVSIVDESSMIDLSVATALVSAISDASSGKQHLVIVGDPDQLPSVGYGNVLADLIESKVIPVCALNTIYRQAKGNPIITNSLKMKNDDADLVWDDPMFRRFHVGSDSDNSEAACKLYLRLVNKVGIENVALLSPYHSRTDIATDILNKKLQDTINPRNDRHVIKRGKLEFRVKDRVMQLRNTEYLSNGDIGTIVKIDPKANDDEPCITVNFENGIQQGYTREELGYLDLAYAFTVHKSQGSQYKCVLIVLPNKVSQFLTRSILYTAVTRSKEYVAIFSPTPTIQYMIHNAKKNVRYSQLVQRLRYCYEKIVRGKHLENTQKEKRAG